MKYVALVYPLFKPMTPYIQDFKKALEEAKEKWEKYTSKQDRHPYHMIKIWMESLKKHEIPFLYLEGIEAENEEKVKEFARDILEEGLPALKEGVQDYEAIILPYVHQIVLDPPEDDNKNGNAFLRGLAVVSTLVTAITVGWLRGVWSE
jgi:ribosome biogenesis GTPase A